MAKKKSNLLSITMSVVEILAVILLFCTLAMSALKTTGTILGASSVSTMSTVDFIGKIFNGDITDGWAIVSLIVYFLTLLTGLIVLVLSVLSLINPRKKVKGCGVEILLLILSVLMMIAMIIYASTLKGNVSLFGSTLADAKTIIDWAVGISVFASALSLISKALNK